MFSAFTVIKYLSFAVYPFAVLLSTRKISFFKRRPIYLYLLMAFPILIGSYLISKM
jgi:hypothetical protein